MDGIAGAKEGLDEASADQACGSSDGNGAFGRWEGRGGGSSGGERHRPHL